MMKSDMLPRGSAASRIGAAPGRACQVSAFVRANRPGQSSWLRQSAAAPSRDCARSGARNVAAQANRTVPVTFSINKQTEYGETVKLVGNLPFMGNWEPSRAGKLKWHEGHVWQGTFDVPVGTDVFFKVICAKDDGTSTWEGGDDRTFKALGPDYALNVTCKWDETSNTRIKAVPLSEAGSAAAPPPAPSGGKSTPPAHRSMDNGWSNGKSRTPSPSSGSSLGLSSLEEDARQTSSWVGAAPEFVRSRIDKGARNGTWRTDGLQGAELDLVRGDKDNSNWLGKLGLMKSLLVDRPHMLRPHMEELAATYVYATWINTGAIRCVETGGHHRPNHHANHALQMFRSLEWAIGDASMGDGGMHWPPEARILAARRLHTRLPSISGEFRVSTPLTRIRDIAHRNDIPKDLKDEIKHTLQNKLHRSAGPEDLVASEAMLQRVTAQPGQYSEAFVNEFKIFIKELREFFNASGLAELLDQVQPAMDEQHRGVVNQFRAAMARLDATPNDQEPAASDLMNALFMGTQARGHFVSGLSAGLRNDVGDDVLAMRQRWRLAEIRLEDYMFVLLARVIGQLERAGGAATLGKANSSAAWKVAVGATVQGLRQLGLSGFATRELLALENEIEAWLTSFAAGGASAKRENALRGKACAERVQRLASQYSDLVMSIYDAPAKRLGYALDVPEHMARVFGESEVRASVAFQVSRLATLMSKALRDAANMDAWDGLVTGEGHGRLVAVESITPDTMDEATRGHDDDVVLLVRRADGDEEVGAHPRLAGVVLCQELPHLSHLGVRARQEKVTFATCDDPDYVSQRIKPLLGRTVKLVVNPDGVSLKEDNSARPAARRGAAAPASSSSSSASFRNGAKSGNGKGASVGGQSMASTVLAQQLALVPLVEAAVNTCGSKAAKCGDLERLARAAGKGLFSTPRGAVLPFGSLELVLQQAGCLREFQACVHELERPDLLGAALDQECERVAEIISGLTLPESLLKKVQSTFGGEALLAVRSSANVEDLAGMSAAGLYESKVGVPADDARALNEAVCEVWASLFSRRAVLSRRAAGVGQADASMAVLIMELVAPDVSFVLHTARPSDANTNVIMAELAPGQGETLASGTRGTPWRLEVDKSTSKVEVLAFANFSRALVVPGSLAAGSALYGSSRSGGRKGLRYASFDEQQGGVGLASRPVSEPRGGLVEVDVDYSKQRLSTDSEYREQIARQLARVGMLVEKSLGGEPQDIEGGLVPSRDGQLSIYVLQTRPQPL